MNISILVAYHKRCWLPQDSVYLPACTALATEGGVPALSERGVACAGRPALCEIQALQWATTKLEASHVGLCHYRRYFGRAAPALSPVAEAFQRLQAGFLPRPAGESRQDSAPSCRLREERAGRDGCRKRPRRAGGQESPGRPAGTQAPGCPAAAAQAAEDPRGGRDAGQGQPEGAGMAWLRRRIFGRDDYERLLARFDIVLPRKRRYVIETVASHYAHAHHREELEAVRGVLLDRQPASLPAFREVMERRWLYLYNMFAMPKPLFDEYADWLLPVLDGFEERVQPWRYPTPYERRAPAFMAERLFNVWLAQRRLRAAECPVVLLGRENWPRKACSFLWRKFVKPGRTS